MRTEDEISLTNATLKVYEYPSHVMIAVHCWKNRILGQNLLTFVLQS
jgi:hypothetical protein